MKNGGQFIVLLKEVSNSNASHRKKDQSNFLEFTSAEKFSPFASFDDDISDTLCLTVEIPNTS